MSAWWLNEGAGFIRRTKALPKLIKQTINNWTPYLAGWLRPDIWYHVELPRKTGKRKTEEGTDEGWTSHSLRRVLSCRLSSVVFFATRGCQHTHRYSRRELGRNNKQVSHALRQTWRRLIDDVSQSRSVVMFSFLFSALFNFWCFYRSFFADPQRVGHGKRPGISRSCT